MEVSLEPMNAPWRSHRCTIEVPWKSHVGLSRDSGVPTVLPHYSHRTLVGLPWEWDFRGTSEFQWDFMCASMANPWEFKVPMVLPHCSHGAFEGLLSGFRGVPMGLANPLGASVVIPWDFRRTSVGFNHPIGLPWYFH